MNYKIGKYVALTDEFEFVFDDGRWINIDLVNDFPNYSLCDKSLINKSKVKFQQTTYDKKCSKENPYSDNGKLYILLFNLYNEHIKITML